MVLRNGGPALNVPSASPEQAGHESDANSIKLEDLGSRHSIPTFTSHDVRYSVPVPASCQTDATLNAPARLTIGAW